MAPRRTLPALTSLRFFAAYGILLLHARGYFGLEKKDALVFWGLQPVSFFFVLSGFILYYCYPKLDGVQATRHFWVARWARIWPMHFLTLLAAAALSFVPNADIPPFAWNLDALWIFLANIFLIHSWIPVASFHHSFNGVSWSISAEFFFYLSFPFLLLHWREKWKWWLAGLAGITIFTMILCWAFQIPGFIEDYNGITAQGLFHKNPVPRLFEFALGMAVGLLFRERPQIGERFSKQAWTLLELSAITLLLLNMFYSHALVAAHKEELSSGLRSWLLNSGSSFSAALVIYVFAQHRGFLSAAFSIRPLYVLGESSYSLYLLHNLYFATFRTGSHPLRELPILLQLPLYSASILILSYFCWRYVELGAREWILGRVFPRG